MFGHCIGLTITYPLCGYFAYSLGWEAAFYFIGALTMLWTVGWYYLVFDSPGKEGAKEDGWRSAIGSWFKEIACLGLLYEHCSPGYTVVYSRCKPGFP